MKLLELYCGTKSITKEFSKVGFDCTTLDIDAQFEPDIVADILKIDFRDLDNDWDVIWASVPCQAFSVAQIGRNWNHDHTPKTETAKLGLEILRTTVDLLNYLKPKIWFIENPVDKMRKLIDFPRYTVTYCQYGDFRMKPTDIWSNLTDLEFLPMCKNGAPCHVAAPRGSQTGTQGMKNAIDKGVIPQELCAYIAKECLIRLNEYDNKGE